MTDVEQVPERWTYLGRRKTQGGKLGALWKTSEGEELLFNSKRHPKVVGGIYDVTVYRTDEGISIGAAPPFVEPPDPDDSDTAKWEAEDRTAVTADAILKAEGKAHRGSPERFGALTLTDLRELYLRQPPIQAAALLGQILRYLRAA